MTNVFKMLLCCVLPMVLVLFVLPFLGVDGAGAIVIAVILMVALHAFSGRTRTGCHAGHDERRSVRSDHEVHA